MTYRATFQTEHGPYWAYFDARHERKARAFFLYWEKVLRKLDGRKFELGEVVAWKKPDPCSTPKQN